MRTTGLPAGYGYVLEMLRHSLDDRRHRMGCATWRAEPHERVRCDCGLRLQTAMLLRAYRRFRPLLRAGLAGQSFPHYESVAGDIMGVARVTADGACTEGRFRDGWTFDPAPPRSPAPENP